MNWLALQFANGSVFFVGMAMTAAAGSALERATGYWWRRLSTVGLLLGIVLVVLSATPLSIAAYVFWFALLLVAAILPSIKWTSKSWPLLCRLAVPVLTSLCIALCLAEMPYHCRPRVPVVGNPTIYVLGDSISAGIGDEKQTWPDVLRRISGWKVVNLSQPGAKMRHGLKQAAGISQPNSLVLLELGGNDLLGDTSVGEFREQLGSLLDDLDKRGCRVAMFELPLLPFANAWGQTQRSLAREHHAQLIPKRCLTSVFGAAGATLDGLHLSPAGNELLARQVQEMLKP